MANNQSHIHECIECGDTFDCVDKECEVDWLGNGQPSYCPDCDIDFEGEEEEDLNGDMDNYYPSDSDEGDKYND